MNKKCSHCGSDENLIANSKRIMKNTGEIRRYYVCRKCNTDRIRKFRKTPEGKLVIYKAVAKSTKKFYDKQYSRVQLNQAILKGRIRRADKCSKCGETKHIEGHHEDYKLPYNVIWLCKGCHADLHKELKLKR